MSLRIAFCGPNLQVNETMSGLAKDFIYDEVLDFTILENPLAQVMERTRREVPFNGHEIDWMNLWAISIRRMDLERHGEDDVVISATCGIDNVCLQATWMAEQVQRSQTGLSLVGADNKPLVTNDAIWINRSGAVLQTILNSTEEEVAEWWDFVYAIMPAIGGSGPLPDVVMEQYQDFLASIPIFKNVVRLPDNVDAASDALKNEVEKWKSKLQPA